MSLTRFNGIKLSMTTPTALCVICSDNRKYSPRNTHRRCCHHSKCLTSFRLSIQYIELKHHFNVGIALGEDSDCVVPEPSSTGGISKLGLGLTALLLKTPLS
ncbi:hypothetical protein CEXT_367921 [Caerostris extrusa]|uniref:Uncharacterized protein n=1 Tax=Caerostris extrusa TaxID=172846 RepID=A0AAV4WIL9_CAEEX|nr:hypothetical protein CEXT_367921 [Caerostris extrusa]